MPKAVKDIELTNMPEVIKDLQSYDHVFLLLRYHGKPVGKIVLPVKDNSLKLADHRDQIQKTIEGPLKFASVDHFLFSDVKQQSLSEYQVTVAICTRNRTNDLKLCLDALMKLPQKGQEILVVDNDPSNDDTKKLVQQYASVKYVVEKRRGLDFARNRAIQEASNDIVAFTDDDALVDPDWLEALLKNFKEPLVMCVTGMTMPLELETKGQEAFEHYSSFGKGFFKKRFSYFNSNPLSTGNVGAGANMALKKELVNEIGWFDEALDAGTPTHSGGDHEFFARILLAGYHIIYEPEALSWHRHRRTWKEAQKAIMGYGVGVYAFWTKLLVVDKQYTIVSFPKGWLLHTQLPNLLKWVLRRGGRYPLTFILLELWGCLKGPFAYFKSRKSLNQTIKEQA